MLDNALCTPSSSLAAKSPPRGFPDKNRSTFPSLRYVTLGEFDSIAPPRPPARAYLLFAGASGLSFCPRGAHEMRRSSPLGLCCSHLAAAGRQSRQTVEIASVCHSRRIRVCERCGDNTPAGRGDVTVCSSFFFFFFFCGFLGFSAFTLHCPTSTTPLSHHFVLAFKRQPSVAPVLMLSCLP